MALVQDNEVYHYHLDHLGTPRELTNNKGDIVWKVRYKTWGNVALKECEEIENNIRFQGQYFDEETGLHYNRHRYYNPDTGQFISQDPIGLRGGVNNYQYAPNPLGWIDPFGLCKDDTNDRSPPPGSYTPNRELPTDEYGVPIPDSNFPHTQLGRSKPKYGSEPQAREWDYGLNGNLQPKRDIDFTDHGFPDAHPHVPHQHKLTPNNSKLAPKGGYKREKGGGSPL